MNISSLREFIVSAPICGETDSLAAIWQLFQRTGTDQIVVVDEQQVPFGVLKLCRFVAVFSIGNALPPVQLQLQQSSLMVHHALIDPVVVLWADGDLAQVQPHLAELAQHSIVLVDSAGRYVGVLDRLQVLHHLAAGSQAAVKFISRPAASTATDAAFPDPLIDLLERLPLPLMLQTSAGRVITQNLAWRQRVGGIQHPQRIRRAAARILEASLACRTDAKPRSRLDLQTGLQPPAIPSLDRRSFNSIRVSSGSLPVGGACQLGTEPNTCVCVCPMKDGQERVWQFIKVPMGMASALANYGGSDHAELLAWPHQPVGQPLLPFKLASLKFSPDPDWRTLMQTETLWLVLAQDMTEQQQVAKELAAKNADLIQLNRLKDEFLACISHELKTPLTAVLGMSSLLKDQLLGGLNERQSHYAQLIYRSGRHLIAIINNILDLTRIETSQLELLLEQVHIPTICQQAYELAQQQHSIENAVDSFTSSEPELHFQLDIHPTLQYIVADELRLRQMLINLLSNAIKFTEPGGEIGLRVEPWEGWIMFKVWDTGIGIPAEKQHLIFQKFQQLEQPLTRQFHGTGLGLVLTQRLARLHGGDISFTSVSDQGSQFTLLLPPVPPQATESDFNLAPSTSSSLSTSERNRLVLVVEADAERLDERVEQLTELGYRAVIARAGTEAIEKARRLQPTAILLNPLLPLLSGWDVLTLLKTDESTCNIPIVVTAVRVEKEQAYQNGADGFLNLPVGTDALERCLKRLVQPSAPELLEPVADITVLHLYEGSPSFTLVSNQHQCRVLEVDDLEQADLLARVWKPDVVLIDRIETEADTFMQQLSQATSLADLPLITLTAEVTRAANQIPGLAVYPYLAMMTASEGATLPNTSELMQIMQLAAGVSWVPNILIVDCGAIELNQAADSSASPRPPVRALVQYLQTAGFRSTISNSWDKVHQALQHQSVDLLLFCVAPSDPAIAAQMVQSLKQLPHQPPVLVWNYQTQTTVNASAPISEPLGTSQWSQVATQILPASLSILELLAQINQTLAERRRQQIREPRR